MTGENTPGDPAREWVGLRGDMNPLIQASFVEPARAGLDGAVPPVSIARAVWRDVWALWQLDRQCFPRIRQYSLLTFLLRCATPNTVCLKAAAGRRSVGFIAANHRAGYTHIVKIGVDPAWRRQGIATRLMQACEEQTNALRIRLRVHRNNAGAIQMYQKMGYVIIRVRPNAYQGEGGYLMEKTVPPHGGTG